jgi:hypothetical protein
LLWLEIHPYETGAEPYNDFPPGEGPGSRYQPPPPAPPPAPERAPVPRPAPTSPVPGPAWRFDPTPPPELTAKPGPKAKVEPKPTPTPAPDPSRKPPKTDDKNRRGQIHHIAGHQNAYSHQFAAIFANATLPGETPLGLDSPINLVRVVRHKGPHGDKYSRIVLNRLRNSVKGLEPHTAPYKEAFLQELGQLRIDINTPKHPLYNMARTSVMPAGDWANKLSVREADEYLESAANPNASRRGGNNCLLNIIPD